VPIDSVTSEREEEDRVTPLVNKSALTNAAIILSTSKMHASFSYGERPSRYAKLETSGSLKRKLVDNVPFKGAM